MLRTAAFYRCIPTATMQNDLQHKGFIEPPVSVSKADEQLAGKDRKAEAQKCLDYAAHDLSYCVVR